MFIMPETRSMRTLLPVFLLLVLGSRLPAIAQQSKLDGDAVPSRVIVKLAPALFDRGISPTILGPVGASIGVVSIEPWLPPELLNDQTPLNKRRNGVNDPVAGLRRIVVVAYGADISPYEAALRLARIPGVEYAEAQHRRTILFRPNDSRLPSQWYLEKISALEAWDVQRGDSSITIGVVDSGIEEDHPDLVNAIWHNPGETGGGRESNNIDDDGNGFIDDVWGWDFAGSNGQTPDNDPRPGSEAHGTLVAGCAAASGDNTIGIAGVAWGCRVMAVKITDDGPSPGLYNEAAGILYAAKMGADVINCSFGGAGHSRAEEEAVRIAMTTYNAVIVAACGNDDQDVPFYPASYPGVISVAATAPNDDKASYSNYNYRIDLSAPGDNILSTGSGDYIYDSGTSFATPLVAGAAALLRRKYPLLGPASIAEILRASVDDNRGGLPPRYADKVGSGRLNISRALSVGTTMQSARISSWTVNESNANGIIEPGETLRIRCAVRNWLSASSDVTVVAAGVEPLDLQVDHTTMRLGAMGEGEDRLTDDTAFVVIVPTTALPNDQLTVSFTTVTADRGNDQFLSIAVSQTFATTDNNDIAVTFNSSGNVGFNGIRRTQGEGLTFRGGKNLLYHGGVMIGVDSARLADVVRLGPTSLGVADGLRWTSLYRPVHSLDSSVQTGEALFSDSHLDPLRRVGVDVRLRTLQYRADGARNFVIARYRITNTSSSLIQGLCFGLYLDWDVSPYGLDDKVDYDAARVMGLVRSARDITGLWGAVTVLSGGGEPLFYAVNNLADGVLNDFTPARKWGFLSSGVVTSDNVDDMAMVIGRGGISLGAGESTEIGMALIVASTFDSLRLAADAAHDYYSLSGVGRYEMEGSGAWLYPNPLGNHGRIVSRLDRPGKVIIKVYSSCGDLVRTIDGGEHEMGSAEIGIDMSGLAAGWYLCRVMTPDGTTTVRGMRVSE